MTAISNIDYTPKQLCRLLATPLTRTTDISIIIPVKNNQKGIDRFLAEFEKTHSVEQNPREIIIVDNNSKPSIEVSETCTFRIMLLKCEKRGPASARNKGVSMATGKWLLFVDSDCIPTATLLTGYLNANQSSIAYAGNVKSLGQDLISKYYETQEILVPPENPNHQKGSVPVYLITANCLVWREAFDKINGFNENITIAGGEDIDLGFRLLQFGQIGYALGSIAYHDFDGGLKGFKDRFVRYGHGNRIVGQLHGLDLRPRPFIPNKKSLLNYILAYLQYWWLLDGWTKRGYMRPAAHMNHILNEGLRECHTFHGLSFR